jgi:hypothetical protein
MDIDIDIVDTVDLEKVFPEFRRASRVDKGALKPHPCGGYFETIPLDPLTNLAAIPFKDAEALGYVKVDFLHLSLLSKFTSKEEIHTLINREPDWSLMEDENIVRQLFQLNNSWEFVSAIKPKSIEEVADTIAIIRPDKRHLLNQYIDNKESTRKKLYRTSADDKSTFRRSHALAYALTVVLQLNTFKGTGGEDHPVVL